MKPKQIYRAYLESIGVEAAGIVSVENDWYGDQRVTYVAHGQRHAEQSISPAGMLVWMFKNLSFEFRGKRARGVRGTLYVDEIQDFREDEER